MDALGQEVPESVFDERFEAVVAEASGERTGEAALAVDLAPQDAAAVAGEVTAGRINFDPAAIEGLK